ncbi:peptidoglycan DD-metalloendopeptidase family protein [bacterium]|nr:peptidoglycan DD-metalloendopeptidase family protein [bacterium]
MEISHLNSLNKNLNSVNELLMQSIPFENLDGNLKNISEDPDKLKEASRGFEEYFIHYMLNQMRQTIPESTLFEKDRGMEIYTSMLDENIAKECAQRGGVGIADLIESQLKEEYPDRFAAKDSNLELKKHRINQNERVMCSNSFYNPVYGSNKYFFGSEGFLMPVAGKLTSEFGMREDPITGDIRMHHGIDIAACEGTPIRAIKDGEVIFSGYRGSYGNVVVIRHAKNYISLYAHNSSNEVDTGDRVKRGQVIASVGDTGRSTGPHLHLELRKDGKYEDPITFFPYQRRR